jgi:hypothetical protein
MDTKGLNFARAALALAMNDGSAAEWAAHRWGQDSKAASITKAAVSIGDTGTHAALHGDYAAAAAEFIELVRAESIIGQLNGLRRVPNRTPFLRQTGSTTANWVGEGKPAPISKAVFTRDTIQLLKLMAMTVNTKELLSGPDADRILRDELLKATREALDTAFIDPANSGVADEQPASITNGLTALTATGTMKTDIEAMVGAFEGDLSRAVFVGSPELFVKVNGDTYPNIGARGGELAGVPAIASTGLPDDGSGKHRLVLLDPGQIIYTGMETATLKSSEAGTIEMSDTPTANGATSTGAELVSLFQCNAVAVGAMIEANWERQREAAVVLLEEID